MFFLMFLTLIAYQACSSAVITCQHCCKNEWPRQYMQGNNEVGLFDVGIWNIVHYVLIFNLMNYYCSEIYRRILKRFVRYIWMPNHLPGYFKSSRRNIFHSIFWNCCNSWWLGFNYNRFAWCFSTVYCMIPDHWFKEYIRVLLMVAGTWDKNTKESLDNNHVVKVCCNFLLISL